MAGSEQESKMNTKKNGSSEDNEEVAGESFPVQKDAKAEGSAEENASASKLEIAEEAGFVARKSSSPERKSNHDAEIESLRERVVTLERKIRELEEVKTCLATQLQVEENKVESNRKDRAATEKLLQETREKHQTQLAAQKEYYTHALAESKEAEASAELRAKHKASSELRCRIEQLQKNVSKGEQGTQAIIEEMESENILASFREEHLLMEIEYLQNRYEASQSWRDELVTQVPKLLSQVEAMQIGSALRQNEGELAPIESRLCGKLRAELEELLQRQSAKLEHDQELAELV